MLLLLGGVGEIVELEGRPPLDGVFDQTLTGGVLLAPSSGFVVEAARSGNYDESVTGGEVLF